MNLLPSNRTLPSNDSQIEKEKRKEIRKEETKFGATSEATMSTVGLLIIGKLTGEINLLTATK